MQTQKKTRIMIKRNKSNLPKLIIHKIGNKFNDTRNLFSDNPVVFDEDSYKLMLAFFAEAICQSYREF